MNQLNLLDLSPLPEAEAAAPLFAAPPPPPPPVAEAEYAEYVVGDLVRCVHVVRSASKTPDGEDTTILPWQGRTGIVEAVDGDRIYVCYDDFPAYPHRARDIEWAEDGECFRMLAEENQPEKAIDQAAVLDEWRFWESTQKWTRTGYMGIGVKARFPNSKVLPVGIEPDGGVA